MTLNEARDILAARYPDRATCFTANCWRHGDRDHNWNSTKFTAYAAATETEPRVFFDGNSIDEVLAQLPGSVADFGVVATPETAEAVHA